MIETPWGLNLKAERELRGISLKELSHRTNISIRHLELFERNAFENLPQGLFLKACIRAYIDNLGLDPDKVYLEFEYLRLLENNRNGTPGKDREGRENGMDIRLPVFGFIIFSAVLLMWWMPGEDRENISAAEPAHIDQTQSDDISEKEIRQLLKSWAETDLTLDSKCTATLTAMPVILNSRFAILTTEPTWIRLKYLADGREIIETMLPGNRRILHITGKIQVEFSDPSLIEIRSPGSDQLLFSNPPALLGFHPIKK